MANIYSNILYDVDNNILSWESFNSACNKILEEYNWWIESNNDKDYIKIKVYQFWLFLDEKNKTNKKFTFKKLNEFIEVINNRDFFDNVIKTNTCFYYETFYSYFKVQKITLRSLKITNAVVIDLLNFIVLLSHYYELLKLENSVIYSFNDVTTYRPWKNKIFNFSDDWELFIKEIKKIEIKNESFLSLDIKSFYGSINRYKIEYFLINALELTENSKEFKIIKNFLNILEPISDDGSIPFLECCPTLTFIMCEIFLKKILSKIKNHELLKEYNIRIFHYVDDIIIVYKKKFSKDNIENLFFPVINNVLKEYGLSTNDSKTFYVTNQEEYSNFLLELPPSYYFSISDLVDPINCLDVIYKLCKKIKSNNFENISNFIKKNPKEKNKFYLLNNNSSLEKINENDFIEKILGLDLINESYLLLSKYPYIFINFINYSDYLLKLNKYDCSFNKNVKKHIFIMIKEYYERNHNFSYSEQFLINLIFLYSINRKCTFTNKTDKIIDDFIKEKMKSFYSLIEQYKFGFYKDKLSLLKTKNIYLTEIHMIWKWFQINVFNNRLNLTFNKNLVVISMIAFLDSLYEKINKKNGEYIDNIKGENFLIYNKKNEKQTWPKNKQKGELFYCIHNYGNKDKFLEVIKKMFDFRNKSSINHNDNKENIKYIEEEEITILYDWIKSLINEKLR